MYQGRKILVVVPARGGSKGIPLKNLQTVDGRSLVARVGDVLRQLDWVDRAVVSTDHDGIAQAAEEAGIAAPFRRPESLSGDRIGDVDVLSHAILEMERQDGCRYDIVIMLQPTSPLRQAADVTACLHKLVAEDLDAVWTVSETDSKGHPLKQLVLRDGRMEYYDPAGASIIARQQLQPVYHRNGVAYAFTRACMLETHAVMGARTGAVVVDSLQISIDTRLDLDLATFFLQRGVA